MMWRKTLFKITILIIGFIFFKFGIFLYARIKTSPCILELPDMLSELWRKPLDCSVCRNATFVDEFSNISSEEFEQRYAYSGRPVVIRGAAKNWKAIEVFDYDFFRKLNNETFMSECQFLTYNDEFGNLDEAFSIEDERIRTNSKNYPWYFGWGVCDPTAVNILRSYYQKPYFLPSTSENYIVDWIFMGVNGFGANLHIDNVHFPSWQAQIKGSKRWTIQTPTECLYVCQERFMVDMFPGDIIILDTNLWYHATEVVSEEISITIGAEYD